MLIAAEIASHQLRARAEAAQHREQHDSERVDGAADGEGLHVRPDDFVGQRHRARQKSESQKQGLRLPRAGVLARDRQRVEHVHARQQPGAAAIAKFRAHAVQMVPRTPRAGINP